MNAQQAWQAATGQLQMEMSKAAFDTWVRSAELVNYQDNTFKLGVSNAYARDWLESRLSSTITRLLTGIMSCPQQVEFVVWQREYEGLEADETGPEIPKDEPVIARNASINPRYTFDTFVVGASNRMAHAACMAVAENPAHAYNPLFLYGGVGLGKTHMLHAIGNEAHRKGLQVLYVSSEEFTNDMISSRFSRTSASWKARSTGYWHSPI
jgi:chromosomal replication initiator protein